MAEIKKLPKPASSFYKSGIEPGNNYTEYEDKENEMGLVYVTENNNYDKDVTNYNFRKIEETVAVLKNEILNTIYPIGSIYITMDSKSPKDILGIGTWELTSSNQLLCGGTAGKALEAGGSKYISMYNLPEHTHWITGDPNWGYLPYRGHKKVIQTWNIGGLNSGTNNQQAPFLNYDSEAETPDVWGGTQFFPNERFDTGGIYGNEETEQTAYWPPYQEAYIWKRIV